MMSKWHSPRYFVAAALAFLMALLLLVVSEDVFHRQVPLVDFTLQPSQYGQEIEVSQPFEVSAGSTALIFMFDAPVDQSWVYLDCRLLRPSRGVAAEVFMNLAHYHGEKNGRAWKTGSQSGSRTLSLPGAGRYQLCIMAAGGGAESTASPAASGPPVRVRIESERSRVWLMTWATLAFGLVGMAMLLQVLVPRLQAAPAEGVEAAIKPRFLFLDGLRGVAVLAVLACHFFVLEITPLAPYLDQAFSKGVGDVIRHGALGVEIFFVLSGFVITHSLGDRAITPRFAGRFVVRRAVRLDPPYYVALGLMLAIVAVYRPAGLFGAWREYGGWSGALSNLFYLHDLLRRPSPLDIAWTLCLEIQFYLTLIVLGMISTVLARSLKGDEGGNRSKVLMLAVLSLMVVSLFCWYPGMERFDFFGTWFRFGLGVITYLAFRRSVVPVWWVSVMVVVVGLSLWRHDLRGLVAAGTAGLIWGAGVSGRLGTWLASRPLQFFGKLSYSIYLIHLAAGIGTVNSLWGLVDHTPVHAVLLMGVGLATSIGGALLLYRFFEKPGMLISQRLK